MRNKKQKYLKDFFRESWEFVVQTRKYILFSAISLLMFSIAGFLIHPGELIESKIIEMLQGLFGKFKDASLLKTIWLLFSNNISVSFFSMALGIFFGFFPLVVILFNGYFLGYVAKLVVSQGGILVMWRLLPHGIFEIPAILISVGMGIRLGWSLLSKKQNTFGMFKESLRAFLLIVLPLILIAAIVEGVLMFFVK